jgi:hypothetical protein
MGTVNSRLLKHNPGNEVPGLIPALDGCFSGMRIPVCERIHDERILTGLKTFLNGFNGKLHRNLTAVGQADPVGFLAVRRNPEDTER